MFITDCLDVFLMARAKAAHANFLKGTHPDRMLNLSEVEMIWDQNAVTLTLTLADLKLTPDYNTARMGQNVVSNGHRVCMEEGV